MSEIEFHEFFRTLAIRLRKETHLSDITFTALEVIPDFKRDFVLFFHPKLKTDDEIEVIREFRLESGDGQPDFAFRCKSWDLIVENKLWDRNYHFEKYGKDPLSPGRQPPYVGLIANHPVTPPAEARAWEIRQWADFLEHFKNKTYPPYDWLFGAYMEYVKKVCAMAEFKNFKVDPDSLLALTHLARMVERTLRTSSSKTYEISVKEDYKRNFGESWAGYFFELRPCASDLRLLLFYGIDFSFESGPPSMTVDVHKDSNAAHFQQIVATVTTTEAYEKKLCTGMLQLKMRRERFNALNSETVGEKQLENLRRFLAECCNALLNGLTAGS